MADVLANPSFEDTEDESWFIADGVIATSGVSITGPKDGDRFALHDGSGIGLLVTQDIDLEAAGVDLGAVDAGTQAYNYTFWAAAASADTVLAQLTFFGPSSTDNIGGVQLGEGGAGEEVSAFSSDGWQQFSMTGNLPPGTRFVTLEASQGSLESGIEFGLDHFTFIDMSEPEPEPAPPLPVLMSQLPWRK